MILPPTDPQELPLWACALLGFVAGFMGTAAMCILTRFFKGDPS